MWTTNARQAADPPVRRRTAEDQAGLNDDSGTERGL
jgi:hypothetical protein